jgi:uncharacterized membrane protein
MRKEKRMKTYKDALSFLLSEQRDEIEDTISKAESMTSSEIRVLVVAASSVLPKHSKKDQKEALRRRAIKEFFKLGIHNTKDKTGVLLMVSIEERMVQVLAGNGINSVVPENTWSSMVHLITEGIKAGNPAQGITMAVADIGKMLSEKFPIKHDDSNELSNAVVIKGRW